MSAISNDQKLEERVRELEGELARCLEEKTALEGMVPRRSAEVKTLRGKLRDALKERKRTEDALRQRTEKYKSVLEGIEEGYFETDLGGYITFFNPAMCEIAGCRPDQLKGMHYREYTTPETAQRMYKIFSNVFHTGRSEKIADYEIIRKDGARRVIELSTALRRNPKGRPMGFQGIARDVTERKKSEAALRRSERQYRLIAENLADVIETFSLEGRFTYASPSVEGLRGWTAGETLSQSIGDVLAPESLKSASQAIAQELTLEARGSGDPRRSRTLELNMRHKAGAVLSTEATFRFLRDGAGQPVEILWVVRDISERKTTQEELAYLAYRDPLTGLFNRKSFLERLDESITYAARYNMERAILYVDLNRFKEVNDAWGHETGDKILQEVADRLRRSLRNTDIVSRLGGDEFTVILNNPVDLYPELAAANLLKTLSLPYDGVGEPIDFITPSIGVSLFPWDGRDGDTLVKKADAAMRRGKGRVKAAETRSGSVHFYEAARPRTDAASGRRRG